MNVRVFVVLRFRLNGNAIVNRMAQVCDSGTVSRQTKTIFRLRSQFLTFVAVRRQHGRIVAICSLQGPRMTAFRPLESGYLARGRLRILRPFRVDSLLWPESDCRFSLNPLDI